MKWISSHIIIPQYRQGRGYVFAAVSHPRHPRAAKLHKGPLKLKNKHTHFRWMLLQHCNLHHFETCHQLTPSNHHNHDWLARFCGWIGLVSVNHFPLQLALVFFSVFLDWSTRVSLPFPITPKMIEASGIIMGKNIRNHTQTHSLGSNKVRPKQHKPL